jgi:hypothetical protein
MSLPSITRDAFLSDDDGILGYYEQDDLKALESAVTELIQADCHAVKIDDEIVFSTYQELTHRERILEYMIREQLMDNTHRHLFAPLLRKDQSFAIEIYLFQNHPWKIVVSFNIHTRSFTVIKKVE